MAARWRRAAGCAATGVLAVYLLLLLGGYTGFSFTTRSRVTVYIYSPGPVTGSVLMDSLIVSVLGLLALWGGGWRLGGALGFALGVAAAGVLGASAPPWAAGVLLGLAAAYASAAATRGCCRVWFLDAVGATLLAAEATGAVGAVLYAAGAGPVWPVETERRLWAPVAVAAPLLVAVAGVAWLASPVAPRWLRKVTGGLLERLRRLFADRPRRYGAWWIAAGILVVAAWVAAAHSRLLNPKGAPVSVDTFYYTRFLLDAERHGLRWVLTHYRGLVRPLYLAIIYVAWRLSGLSPFTLMDVVHPVAAAALLAASSYLVARRRGMEQEAGLAAFLAATGPTMATFLLSGYQANSVALPIALLYLASPSLPLLILLMILAALIHPWTHVVYTAALAVDEARRRGRRAALKSAGLGAVVFLAAEAVNRALAGASAAAATTSPLIHGTAVMEPLYGLYRGSLIWTWGAPMEAPWILLLGATYPWYTVAAAVEAAVSPGLVFGGTVVAHRLLVDTPFWLPAASAASRLRSRLLRTALIAATLAGLAYMLAAAAPLTGKLWWSILYHGAPAPPRR